MLMKETLEDVLGERLLINNTMVTPVLEEFDEVETNVFNLRFAGGAETSVHASWSVVVPTPQQVSIAQGIAADRRQGAVTEVQTRIDALQAALADAQAMLAAVQEAPEPSFIQVGTGS